MIVWYFYLTSNLLDVHFEWLGPRSLVLWQMRLILQLSSELEMMVGHRTRFWLGGHESTLHLHPHDRCIQNIASAWRGVVRVRVRHHRTTMEREAVSSASALASYPLDLFLVASSFSQPQFLFGRKCVPHQGRCNYVLTYCPSTWSH